MINMSLHLVLFNSRNKDNKSLKNEANKNYKQRSYQFLTHKSVDDPELRQMFKSFVSKGLPGEVSRFYYSVNARSEEKVQKTLMHYLLDHTVDLATLDNLAARLASKAENRAENKWLFDCDDYTKEDTDKFVEDLTSYAKDTNVVDTVVKTRSGYHVVVKHGFDTRELLEKHPNVSLKRDEFLYVDSEANTLEWVYEL